jgi:hypothetical protein
VCSTHPQTGNGTHGLDAVDGVVYRKGTEHVRLGSMQKFGCINSPAGRIRNAQPSVIIRENYSENIKICGKKYFGEERFKKKVYLKVYK